MHPVRRTLQTGPRPWPKLNEPVTIIWKRPASYRLITYGELQEQDRRERWCVRRIVSIALCLLVSYPLSLIFWQVVLRQHPGPVNDLIGEGLSVLAIPLQVATWVMPPLESWLADYEQWCASWMRTRPEALVPAVSMSLLSMSLLWLFALYALSPIASWFLARFCGFDHLPLFTSQMYFVYGPLEWLADRSQTLRRFYQIYFEVQEELD